MSDINKERAKRILDEIEASRKKNHAEILLIILETGELTIGKFDQLHSDESTGEGFIILSGRKIPFDQIRKVE